MYVVLTIFFCTKQYGLIFMKTKTIRVCYATQGFITIEKVVIQVYVHFTKSIRYRHVFLHILSKPFNNKLLSSPNPTVLKIKRVFTSVYGLSTLKINGNCMCTHTFHLLMFGEKFCAVQVYRNIKVCFSVVGEEIPLLENPILKYVDMLFQMTLSGKLTSTIDLLVRAVTMLQRVQSALALDTEETASVVSLVIINTCQILSSMICMHHTHYTFSYIYMTISHGVKSNNRTNF